VGLEKDGAVLLAIRKQEIADALGLSLVHPNKTLVKLQKSGLVRPSDNVLHIRDRARLATYAGSAPEPLDKRPLV